MFFRPFRGNHLTCAMSLRQAFRSKIKDVLHGGDHHGYHPIASDQDGAQNEAETTSIKSTQVRFLVALMYTCKYVACS